MANLWSQIEAIPHKNQIWPNNTIALSHSCDWICNWLLQLDCSEEIPTSSSSSTTSNLYPFVKKKIYIYTFDARFGLQDSHTFPANFVGLKSGDLCKRKKWMFMFWSKVSSAYVAYAAYSRLQVEVGEGEEAVLECGVQGLASIHMVIKIYLKILKRYFFAWFGSPHNWEPFLISCVSKYLASQDALEVMRVTHSLTHSLSHSALALTLLMWPWWVMIPIEDFTDVTLVSDESYLVMKVI